MAFNLKIDGFAKEGQIPAQFTCQGANRSPAVHWTDAPPETRSLALIVDDPDAPSGVWNHWLVWDIPANVSELVEGYHARSPVREGINDFGASGYGGPCPPRGHGPHRYFFRLFALDVETLNIRASVQRRDLERALKHHVIAMAEYYGVFERK